MSCRAEVEWALTTKGKAIPLDLGTFDNGNLVLETQGQTRIAVSYQPLIHSHLPRRRTHFATCPDAAEHRKMFDNEKIESAIPAICMNKQSEVEKDYGPSEIAAVLGVCVGSYLHHKVTKEELLLLVGGMYDDIQELVEKNK